MFKKSKNKEEKKSDLNKTGATSTSTFQTSSERRLSENVIEKRTYTSSSYSSVRVTKTELGKTTVSSSPTPLLSKSVSLFDNNSGGLKPLSDRLQALDVKPFNTSNSITNGGGGYHSSFSRKLTPYNLDARPFTPSALPPSSPRKTIAQITPISTNPPRYSSYVPQRGSTALNTSLSTQSLPTASETSPQDSKIPTYNTQGKKRGKVLVINNIKFLEEKQERKGAEMDERNIKSLFKEMGFDVEVFRDQKRNAMADKINKFSKDTTLKKVDIAIVIMMSHGSNVDDTGKVIQGGFTQIYGIDDQGLPIDEILDKFSAQTCPAMAGKPKIFIFQCCRGESEERTLHNDVAPTKKNIIKKHADMLIAFSTLPGFFSIRDIQQGSWYIQGIYEVFKKHAKEFDVETLLKIVDDQLSRKHPTYQQTSTYENRGFKRCFLNPK